MTDDVNGNSASINIVEEKDATGKALKIYEEIKTTLGIDFVPNMYKVMAAKPDYLAANWNRIKAVMQVPGKLDKLTKETEKAIAKMEQGTKMAPAITLDVDMG